MWSNLIVCNHNVQFLYKNTHFPFPCLLSIYLYVHAFFNTVNLVMDPARDIIYWGTRVAVIYVISFVLLIAHLRMVSAKLEDIMK